MCRRILSAFLLPILLPHLCLIDKKAAPTAVDCAIQIMSANQAEKMARTMVDGAVELVRQKYRLERGWKAAETGGGAKGELDGEEEEKLLMEKPKRRRNHHHHHHHQHRHHQHGHKAASALKYRDEEMERVKARGKQLIEALGVKDDEDDVGETAGKKRGAGAPMTMRSLFGKFTRRD